MNKKSISDRVKIVRCLIEGNSLRSTSRIVGVSVNTVSKLLRELGFACGAYQSIHLRNLPCKRMQVDEQRYFIYSKGKNTAHNERDQKGTFWLWSAMCPDTKIVPTWLIGNREGSTARKFMHDLAARLTQRVQLTTDGYPAYPDAVEFAFGDNVDYARLVKQFKNNKDGEEVVGILKETVCGNPDPAHISTSLIERQNLTVRMGCRRYTRKTNAFSKKVDPHIHATGLHYMYYNFVRIHQTLRVTPAMAAGVTDRLWDLEDIVDLTNWDFQVI